MIDILTSLKIDVHSDHPISLQIADQLIWMVASGRIRQGEKLPATRALADYLDINYHTVRAAYKKLEDRNLVATRHGSGSVVLDFDPVSVAAQTPGPATHTIGIIIPNLINPFHGELIRGAEDVARRNHILLIVCSTYERASKGREFVDMLVAKRVDGLVILPLGLERAEDDRDLTADPLVVPIPLVLVDRPGEAGPAVLLDSEGAGYAATVHLINHGHRRIGMITCSLDVPALRQTYLGFSRALQEHGLEEDPALIIESTDFTSSSGYQAARKLFQGPARPSAIFTSGDLLAIGAIRAIRESGLKLPGDMSLASYNNIDLAADVDPPLTTVQAPTYELGVKSMEMMLKIIAGEELRQKQVTLPTKLVIRKSCGCDEERVA